VQSILYPLVGHEVPYRRAEGEDDRQCGSSSLLKEQGNELSDPGGSGAPSETTFCSASPTTDQQGLFSVGGVEEQTANRPQSAADVSRCFSLPLADGRPEAARMVVPAVGLSASVAAASFHQRQSLQKQQLVRGQSLTVLQQRQATTSLSPMRGRQTLPPDGLRRVVLASNRSPRPPVNTRSTMPVSLSMDKAKGSPGSAYAVPAVAQTRACLSSMRRSPHSPAAVVKEPCCGSGSGSDSAMSGYARSAARPVVACQSVPVAFVRPAQAATTTTAFAATVAPAVNAGLPYSL